MSKTQRDNKGIERIEVIPKSTIDQFKYIHGTCVSLEHDFYSIDGINNKGELYVAGKLSNKTITSKILTPLDNNIFAFSKKTFYTTFKSAKRLAMQKVISWEDIGETVFTTESLSKRNNPIKLI